MIRVMSRVHLAVFILLLLTPCVLGIGQMASTKYVMHYGDGTTEILPYRNEATDEAQRNDPLRKDDFQSVNANYIHCNRGDPVKYLDLRVFVYEEGAYENENTAKEQTPQYYACRPGFLKRLLGPLDVFHIGDYHSSSYLRTCFATDDAKRVFPGRYTPLMGFSIENFQLGSGDAKVDTLWRIYEGYWVKTPVNGGNLKDAGSTCFQKWTTKSSATVPENVQRCVKGGTEAGEYCVMTDKSDIDVMSVPFDSTSTDFIVEQESGGGGDKFDLLVWAARVAILAGLSGFVWWLIKRWL